MCLKYILSFFCACCFIFNSLDAQSTFAQNDPDTQFKLAKEMYQKGRYSLAMPVFKKLLETTFPTSNYPAEIQLECTYYTIVCGLQLNDVTYEQRALQFVLVENNTMRISLLHFELANYYFRKKDFTNALAYYKKCTVTSLNNTDVATLKFQKAYCHFALKQFDDAKPLFNSIRQIPEDDNYIPANYYYGFICFFDKHYNDALQSFTIAEQQPNYQLVVPFYISEILYFKNEIDSAIGYAERYIQKGGQYYDLQLKQLAGHLLFEKKYYTRAQVYLEEYVNKTEKVNRQDLYELSYCYYESGGYDKCIQGFKQLGGKEDSLAQNSMYLLADAYLKTNQKANARNAFLFCESNNSNPTQKEISMFSYAKLSYELNYLDVALKELQEYIVLYPSSKNIQEAKELLIAVLSNTSNYREAYALFEKLQKPSENAQKIYPRILYGRVVELINDQKSDDAEVLLNKLMQVSFNTAHLPYAFFWKGELAYKSGKLEEAIGYLNNYLKQPKMNGEVNITNARYILGYCLLKKGDYKQSLAHFQYVVNHTYNTAESNIEQDAFVRSADCYFMLTQYKQALKMYEEVYVANGKNADYALYQKAVIAGALNKSGEKLQLFNTLLQQFANSGLVADVQLEIANTHLSAEKYNEAIAPLQWILKNKSAEMLYPQAYLKTGVAYYNLHKNEEALNAFTTLVTNYANTAESDDAIDYIRNIFVDNQRPNDFVAFMKKNGKAISVSEADSLNYRSAYLRYEAKDYEAAKKGFIGYLSQFADGKYIVEANYFGAEAALASKQPKEALGFYKTVVAKAPNKYAERSALQTARMYFFDEKDYAIAEIYYAQLKLLTAQQEARLEAMRGLLRCQYKQQKWKLATINADELLKEKAVATDDKMMANMVMAKSYQTDSIFDKAVTYYNLVIALGKSEFSAEAMYRLAEIKYVQLKYSEAEKAAFDVIKKAGSYEYWVTKSYLLLGDVYFKTNDLFNAEATYKSIADNATIAELKKESEQKLAQVIEVKNKTNKVE